MFVVVNFDALAQASDIRIERRQVIFLCWRQDSNPSGSQTPNRQQTECPLTSRLSYRGSSKNLNSTARPYDQRAFIHTYLLLLILMLWHRQAIFESKGDKLSSFAEGRIRTQWVSDTYSPADWMPADKPTELSSIKQHTFIHTYIHTYMFVVVNFDALAQASDIRIERRQVVLLCWEQDSNPSGSQTPNRQQMNAHRQTDWAIEDQAKNLNSTARPYDQRAFSPLDPTAVWHSHLALAIYMFVVVNFDALAQASDIRIERRPHCHRGETGWANALVSPSKMADVGSGE